MTAAKLCRWTATAKGWSIVIAVSVTTQPVNLSDPVQNGRNDTKTTINLIRTEKVYKAARYRPQPLIKSNQMVYQQDLTRLGLTTLFGYFDLIINVANEDNIVGAFNLLDELSAKQREEFFKYGRMYKINLEMFI